MSEHKQTDDETRQEQSYGELIKQIIKSVGQVVKYHIKDWAAQAFEPLRKLKSGCITLTIAATLVSLGLAFVLVAAFLGLAYLINSYAGALAIMGGLCIIVAVILLKKVFAGKDDDNQDDTPEQALDSDEQTD